MTSLKERLYSLLRASERYTKTDMAYLLGGGFWINLGVVATSLMSLAIYVVFANVLSPETYGVYRYLLSAAALIGMLSLTGFNTAITRAVARGFEGDFRKSIRFQIAWSWLPLCAALAVAVYYAWQDDYRLSIAFVCIGMFLPFINILNAYSAFLIGKKDFKRQFLYSTGAGFLLYGALAVTALFFPHVVPLILVFLAAQLVGALLGYRATVRTYRPGTKTEPDTLRYGTHLSLMGVPGSIAQQADSLIIFHLLGPVPLAIYALATAIPNRLVGLFKFLSTALLPRFAQQGFKEAKEAASLGRTSWMILLILVFSAAYALMAPYVFALLFPTYDASVALSQLYAFSMVGIVGNIFWAALASGRKLQSLYTLSAVASVGQVILLAAGVYFFGLWGAVWAKLASTLFTLAVGAFLVATSPHEATTDAAR